MIQDLRTRRYRLPAFSFCLVAICILDNFPRLPNVYQKSRQLLVLQGVGGFLNFRASTGCLPVSLFYAKTDGFQVSFLVFPTF